MNTTPSPSSPRPATVEIWDWLREVPDPEIPVLSVVDLGIVRDVRWEGEDRASELVVTITPTYSGCPATSMIAFEIERAIRDRGVRHLRLETRISPPWTTDWISEAGRERLKNYGIAPPPKVRQLVDRIGGGAAPAQCPHCGSDNTIRVSEFGSTPCKALYKCGDCLEPFDLFKCH
ncbi:MAG: 1,2-phenylacetyl-CoA epoxidase subunit PaaD [Rhodospirillales bacterium]